MSVSYSLFQVIPDLLHLSFEERLSAIGEETTKSFGCKASVIERLCSVPEFSHDIEDDEVSLKQWHKFESNGRTGVGGKLPILTHLIYQYPHSQNQG